jgi:hypothetical protein
MRKYTPAKRYSFHINYYNTADLVYVSAVCRLLSHFDNSSSATSCLFSMSNCNSRIDGTNIISCSFVITAFPPIKSVWKVESALDITKNAQYVIFGSSAENGTISRTCSIIQAVVLTAKRVMSVCSPHLSACRH